MCGEFLRVMQRIRGVLVVQPVGSTTKHRQRTRNIRDVPPVGSLTHEQATLVFDGDCGFCTTAVRWLGRSLPAFPAAIPYQWAELDELGLTRDEASEQVWLVARDRSGSLHQYGGHLAVSVMLRHQPALGWRFLGVLLDTLPFSLAASLGYRLVAKYRYLLPGGTPACRVGAPSD